MREVQVTEHGVLGRNQAALLLQRFCRNGGCAGACNNYYVRDIMPRKDKLWDENNIIHTLLIDCAVSAGVCALL